MAGAGYNIPISVSASASADSGGPFSDDTIINFSGGQTATPWQSNTPDVSAVATSSAAEGNAASATQSANGTGNSAQPSPQLTSPVQLANETAGQGNTLYIVIAAAAIGVYLLLRK